MDINVMYMKSLLNVTTKHILTVPMLTSVLFVAGCDYLRELGHSSGFFHLLKLQGLPWGYCENDNDTSWLVRTTNGEYRFNRRFIDLKIYI